MKLRMLILRTAVLQFLVLATSPFGMGVAVR